MKIDDLKLFLQNRLTTLEASRMSALSIGDLEAFNKVDVEYKETEITLNSLKSI